MKRDAVARVEKQKSAAVRGLIKLGAMTNDAQTLAAFIEHQISEMDKAGHQTMDTWQKITPIAGYVLPIIRFDADEVTFLIELKEYRYLNALLRLAESHASTVKAVDFFGKHRIHVSDEFPAVMSGKIGVGTLEGEAALRYASRGVELEDLINQIRTASTSRTLSGQPRSKASRG